jgi:hypothetical protein
LGDAIRPVDLKSLSTPDLGATAPESGVFD